MTPAEQILIVVAGTLLTLLIGGALVYWIDRERRELNTHRRRRRDATRHAGAQDTPDNSPGDESPSARSSTTRPSPASPGSAAPTRVTPPSSRRGRSPTSGTIRTAPRNRDPRSSSSGSSTSSRAVLTPIRAIKLQTQ